MSRVLVAGSHADTLPRGIRMWDETGDMKPTSEHSLFKQFVWHPNRMHSCDFDFNNISV